MVNRQKQKESRSDMFRHTHMQGNFDSYCLQFSRGFKFRFRHLRWMVASNRSQKRFAFSLWTPDLPTNNNLSWQKSNQNHQPQSSSNWFLKKSASVAGLVKPLGFASKKKVLRCLHHLPSGKHTKNYGKSPFSSWVNPLFQWLCSTTMFYITRG